MLLTGIVPRLKSWEDRLRRWEGQKAGRDKKVFWIIYTLCFVIISFCSLGAYPFNGASLAWDVDGLEQYYPFFIYVGQWVRGVVGGFLTGQGLQFPLWDMSLGYGSDIPSVLDVIYNPFYLISAVCPERYSEYFFQFLVVLRMYLAGVAFSLLARYRGNGRFATLCGALVYSLCGTALAALLWPDGINPMILFPLLLLGVEKIFNHEKPYLFIFSIVFFFVTSYYFAYMACLLLLLYCGFRVFVIERRRGNRVTVKLFITWAARFLAYLVVGILVACVVLVPSLTALFSLDRVSHGDVAVPLLYPFGFYQKAMAGFLGASSVGSDCFIGFGGIALLSCFLLFIKKRNRNLKIIFLALTVILLVPFLGSVFNGFNYATNRWVWAYALCVSYIVVKMVPLLSQLDRRELKSLCLCAVAYALVLFTFAGARSEWSVAAIAFMFASLVFLGWQGRDVGLWRVGFLTCIAACIICNAFYFTSPDEFGWARSSPKLGSMYAKLTQDTPNRLVADIDDTSVWRYDVDPTTGSRPRNSSAVLGINGFDFYNSVYENDIDRFHTEMGVANTHTNFSYANLGGRPLLEVINGVKYYVIPDRASEKAPYNYSDRLKIVAQKTIDEVPYAVYEGSHVLPLGFTYAGYIPRSVYETYTPAQKQESLLQGVVLEDSSLPKASVDLDSFTVPYTVAATDGLSFEEGKITAMRPNATLTLQVEGAKEAETYLAFNDLSYRGMSPSESMLEKKRNELSWYENMLLMKKDIEWSEPVEYNISMQADEGAGRRVTTNFISSLHLYGGKSTWLSNLGYSSKPQSTITMTFSQAGEYRFKGIDVVCQPMHAFNDRVDALGESVMENIEVGTNQITGSIDLQEKKALYLSIPYSSGWTAYLDGQQVPIKKANTAFMALELEAGHHDIKLVYMTPGLVVGEALSCVGVGLCVIIVIGNAVRDRKKRRIPNGA
ncbi:MAG: YfhO family protein [Raoultibacter sp.]